MITNIKVELHTEGSFPPDAKLEIAFSPRALHELGFVMPVIVQTPSILCYPPISKPLKTVLVMALLDTGATKTCISGLIAEALELNAAGFSQTHTASGLEIFADYAVDVLFPNAHLRSFENLKVGSCNLPYNHDLPDIERMRAANFGVLIGRDMMTRWNIVWNGPTSSIFISD